MRGNLAVMQIYVNRLVQFGEKAIKDLGVFKFQKGLKMLSQGKTSEEILNTIGKDITEFSMRTGIQKDALGSFWSRLKETIRFGFKKWFRRPFIKYEDDLLKLFMAVHELGHAIVGKITKTPIKEISLIAKKLDSERTMGAYVTMEKTPLTTKENILKSISIYLAGFVSSINKFTKLLGENGEKIFSSFYKKEANGMMTFEGKNILVLDGIEKDVEDILSNLKTGKEKGFFPKATEELLKITPLSKNPDNSEVAMYINALWSKLRLPYVMDIKNLVGEVFDRIPVDRFLSMLSELRQKEIISSWSIESFFKRHDLGWTKMQEWFEERLQQLSAQS